MRARVLLVLLLLSAAGCGGGGQSASTSGGGVTTAGAATASGGPTTTTGPAPSADRGSLGYATFAAEGEEKEVLARPEPFTAESTQGWKRAPHCKDDRITVTAATRARAEAAAVCLVNKRRAGGGIRRLRNNRALYRAAQRHAADMVRNRYFSHTSKGGTAPAGRAAAAGYAKSRGWQVGENIAWGSGTLSTPASIVQAWMDSPGHRANLLRRSFREAGLAIVVGSPAASSGAGGTYVQVFGRRGRR
jgi:uncharacterized protein YkwD